MVLRKLIIIFLLFVAAAVFGIEEARAEKFEVSPHIIDAKAKARDILEYDVKLKNNGDVRATFYVLVYDTSPDNNIQNVVAPSELDKQTSVTRWVRIKRGAIDVMPGEEVEIPLSVEINLNAIPGKYYAAVTFAHGTNITRAQESFARSPQPTVLLNIEVEEHIIEKAQMTKFEPEKNIFFKYPAILNFSITNYGNKNIVPQGFLYIYNRQNQEIAKLPINEERQEIAPEDKKDFSVSWEGGRGFGKYKAKVELEYGSKDVRDIQETVYFWMLDWKYIAVFGGGLILCVIVLSILIFKKTFHAPIHLPFGHQEPTVDLRNKKS